MLSLLGEDYHIIHIKFNLFNEMSAYDHYPTDKAYSSDSRVTNISKSFTRKMAAKTSWHRYETKLRHCHHMHGLDTSSTVFLGLTVVFDRQTHKPRYMIHR